MKPSLIVLSLADFTAFFSVTSLPQTLDYRISAKGFRANTNIFGNIKHEQINTKQVLV